MNPLERLEKDWRFALILDNYVSRSDSLSDAIRTFISKYEAVPAAHYPADNSIRETWCRCTGAGELTGEFHTILVPRTQEPTLLEAVGEARDIVGSVLEVERGRAAQASVRLLESAYDALATAISKEESED